VSYLYLCQKLNVKVIFEAPETVWWLDLTDPDPIFYDRSTPLMVVPQPNRNPNRTLSLTLTKRDPDYSQNRTDSSVARVPYFHRILWKPVEQFLHNPANKQTK